MRRSFVSLFSLSILMTTPLIASAADVDAVQGEKDLVKEFKSQIPKERYKSPEELYKKLKAGTGNVVVIDVRSEDEFENGHIEGAVNIDYGRANLVPARWPDANTEIWVNCRMKHRATYFTALLSRFGYKNVYLLDGGIAGWLGKGYPVVNKYLGELTLVKSSDYINQKE